MSPQKISSFTEFWPFYLGEHRHPVNRALHVAGTLTGVGLVVYALATQRYLVLLVAPVLAYGAAFLGHFVFEQNRPATFKHPLMSFLADFKMIALILTGRLSKHLAQLPAESQENQ